MKEWVKLKKIFFCGRIILERDKADAFAVSILIGIETTIFLFDYSPKILILICIN